MIKLLHFADAHIDMAGRGRQDPVTGLPLRVQDFLKALDLIIDTAIAEGVDLVIFSGDAYKDRTPAPTYQREWGRRIMRLSNAHIPAILLVGNHDVPPAAGRAHAMQEFETLQPPHTIVCGKPMLLSPAELAGLPLQIIALPWVYRSGLMAALEMSAANPDQINTELEVRIRDLVNKFLESLDPNLPTILVAHASIQGAKYGTERTVMLGSDLVLPQSLVCDPRFDYVALGHIHKAQNLNEGAHPPVIYPGSIERVDFGEVGDEKYFVIADVERGRTRLDWRRLPGRKMIDRMVVLNSAKDFETRLPSELPSPGDIHEAIVRLTVEYPQELEMLLDEPALRRQMEGAFEFHLRRQPRREVRLRLAKDSTASSHTPLELLEKYWQVINLPLEESNEMQQIAANVIQLAASGDGEDFPSEEGE
ncbi:MAG TPA: exonuclease SbcCD subunit D [Anaerolineaceae bacterium]